MCVMLFFSKKKRQVNIRIVFSIMAEDCIQTLFNPSTSANHGYYHPFSYTDEHPWDRASTNNEMLPNTDKDDRGCD